MVNPINMMIQLFAVLIPLIIAILLFSSTLLSKRKWHLAFLLFISIAGPFTFLLLDEHVHPTLHANINLGYSILFVWFCSGLLFLWAIIRIYIKTKKT